MKLYAANGLDYLDQKVNWVITTTCLLMRTFKLEHDAPKLTDFGDNIMLQNIDFDHDDFGLIQSKIIVI